MELGDAYMRQRNESSSVWFCGIISGFLVYCEQRSVGHSYGASILASKLPDNKVHGAYMGPTWGRQDPGGPHVGPMNLAIRERGQDIIIIRGKSHIELLPGNDVIKTSLLYRNVVSTWNLHLIT